MDGLFRNLHRKSGKKGIEALRSGGSQRISEFNNLMKKHLKNPGCFPCHASGSFHAKLSRFGLSPP
eukprot:5548230-Ditylum_brightwellii.AAC.1